MTITQTHRTAIEVHHLVKRYPKSKANAVDDVSFTIPAGEIFGLLGPNGAGKTSTIAVLTTAASATSGDVRIMDVDIFTHAMNAKQHIAVVPQQNNLDRSLRAREVLTFHASYHGVPRAEREARADTLLKELGMESRGNDAVARYSGGMAQRLMLARALMHTPDVLFLDEPTNNLDPQSRRFLWEYIRSLNKQGITILLTTHDIDEAEQLCNRVAIMDHGKILVLDTPDELKKLIHGGFLLELRLTVPDYASVVTGRAEEENKAQDVLLAKLRALPGITQADSIPVNKDEPNPVMYRLATEDTEAAIPIVIQVALENGATVHDLHVTKPTLEDAFIHLTGRKLRS